MKATSLHPNQEQVTSLLTLAAGFDLIAQRRRARMADPAFLAEEMGANETPEAAMRQAARLREEAKKYQPNQ